VDNERQTTLTAIRRNKKYIKQKREKRIQKLRYSNEEWSLMAECRSRRKELLPLPVKTSIANAILDERRDTVRENQKERSTPKQSN
jgi:hypothetical protein